MYPPLNNPYYHNGKGPKVDKRKSIKDRKSILAEKCIDKGRKKSIENEKSNPKGGRKSSDFSEKSINKERNSNCSPNFKIEKTTNDEKLIYAQKSSPKDNKMTSSPKEKPNPKPSNNAKKSSIMCGSCHIRNVLIGVEYRNCCRTYVYLLSAIWMGQIQSKQLIYIFVTYGLASL